MSKKKSLGSSPIGYSALATESSTYQFIPRIKLEDEQNVSDASNDPSGHNNGDKYNSNSSSDKRSDNNEGPEKKIKSYYLEIELINRLNTMADEKGIYYSTVVSDAIEHWIEIHGY